MSSVPGFRDPPFDQDPPSSAGASASSIGTATPGTGRWSDDEPTIPIVDDRGTPRNLGFDDEPFGRMPPGWCNGAGFVDDVSTAYEIDTVPRDDGCCVRLHHLTAEPGDFGTVMQRVRVTWAQGQGDRLVLVGHLRTKVLEGWAGMWLRLDGPDSIVFFDNMAQRPLRGQTPWTRVVLQAPLHREVRWINFGVVLMGRGTVYADDFELTTR